jgi:DNA polymerase I-like protein with 3'-5' exonuclease and polymerase domains/5'-3' exonuclease
MATLLLIDGNALFYRAYHAFPKELTTPDGTPSGAAFGFTRILLAAIKQHKPTHLIACFDTKGGTFRDDFYDAYKATRAAMPEELAAQVPIIWEIVDTLEIPRLSVERYEADDLIGTIAHQAASHDDLDVIILSGDQDLVQLVTPQVAMFSPAMGFSKATLYTPEKVMEKYTFTPAQMIDYKGLRGDSSDNIPGVPGIGEVTAKQLLSQFKTLDGVYEAVSAGDPPGVAAGVLKKLRAGEESARLSYRLATIATDAPVKLHLKDAVLSIENPVALVALFEKLGFKSLINELPSSHRLATAVADVFGSPSSQADGEVGKDVSTTLDTQLAPILRGMEEHGVMVDTSYLQKLEKEFASEISDIREALTKEAGQDFNPDSPAQVGTILYEVLKVPTEGISKGKTGYTTNADTLEKLEATYPIAGLLLKYREVTKLQSTYIKPLQELTDAEHRIHTSYAPDTATGRISSRNPNLQNIPVRSEQGKRIRQAFIAPKGSVFVAADYSQIELRVAAHLSGDPVMVEAFKSGKDFHAETAERMGVDRRVAKIINFSILYGKGAFGFAQDLGISVAEAKEYIEQYFVTFKVLREYIDALLVQAKVDGFVTTLMGRQRMLPELTASNFQRRSAAEREAVNLPIQGTAAEILKKAMVDLSAKITHGAMILTVHDELVLEVPEEHLAETVKLLKETMEHAVELIVPIEVQVKTGKDWANLTPLA